MHSCLCICFCMLLCGFQKFKSSKKEEVLKIPSNSPSLSLFPSSLLLAQPRPSFHSSIFFLYFFFLSGPLPFSNLFQPYRKAAGLFSPPPAHLPLSPAKTYGPLISRGPLHSCPPLSLLLADRWDPPVRRFPYLQLAGTSMAAPRRLHPTASPRPP
jgi:hypothetical protein